MSLFPGLQVELKSRIRAFPVNVRRPPRSLAFQWLSARLPGRQ